MRNKILFILVCLLIGIKLSLFIFQNREYYLRPFDPVFFGDLYSKSQYVLGPRSIGGIGDDGLYAFAGYYYLFQGGDVTAVNFEHPPLGKYLIGLSVFFFNNENIINIFYFLALLLVTYKLALIILKNQFFAAIPPLLLSFNDLFLDNLLRSLLDLPFTLFFVSALYFFIKGCYEPKYHYLSALFWGFAFSTRFFPAIVIFYPLLFLFIIIRFKDSIATFAKGTLIIPLVYLVSHISFFVYHPSFIEFLKHKRWMLSWFSGTVVNTGNIWRDIYTGTYIDSTGKLVVDGHWSLLIPIVTTLAIFPFRRKILERHEESFLIIYIISIIFLFYVTVLTLGIQKFIMPVYPLIAILATSRIGSLYSIIRAWQKRDMRVSRKK